MWNRPRSAWNRVLTSINWGENFIGIFSFAHGSIFNRLGDALKGPYDESASFVRQASYASLL